MAADKKICCVIMLCQMSAILSGVAIMYLSVIVVIPSKNELAMEFMDDPIMCTTVQAIDLAAGGKKVECKWSTCGEWCLSKPSSPCMQIYAMPRKKGHPVILQECDISSEDTCSAMDPETTNEVLCRKGECKDITGLFNCSKDDENPCKDISIAYKCPNARLNENATVCTDKKCAKRLSGVYTCTNGKCNRLLNYVDYKSCERKCSDLKLAQGNALIFSSKKMYQMNCKAINSTGNNTLNDLNNNRGWMNGGQILMIFCTFLEHTEGKQNVIVSMDDCFNATLINRRDISGLKTYLDLIDYRNSINPNSDWFIKPEEHLRMMNDTVLKINAEGCVNSLTKECRAFFATHATDGRDGRIPDRYNCFYTDQSNEFVVGKYNPEITYLMLMITSILPGCLFIVSCCALFFCSKSIGVDEVGHLKVTMFNNKGKGGAPGGSMMEMEL